MRCQRCGIDYDPRQPSCPRCGQIAHAPQQTMQHNGPQYPQQQQYDQPQVPPQQGYYQQPHPQAYAHQMAIQQYQQPIQQSQSMLVCPRCRSHNVSAQVVNEIDLKIKHKGCLWWLIIGWWWVPFKWLYFFWIALIVKIFKPKNYKTVNRSKTYKVCQNCGHTWS